MSRKSKQLPSRGLRGGLTWLLLLVLGCRDEVQPEGLNLPNMKVIETQEDTWDCESLSSIQVEGILPAAVTEYRFTLTGQDGQVVTASLFPDQFQGEGAVLMVPQGVYRDVWFHGLSSLGMPLYSARATDLALELSEGHKLALPPMVVTPLGRSVCLNSHVPEAGSSKLIWPRAFHGAVRLEAGQDGGGVLLMGGLTMAADPPRLPEDPNEPLAALSTVEIYDARKGLLTPTTLVLGPDGSPQEASVAMNEPRALMAFATTSDGRVLIVGGAASSFILNPALESHNLWPLPAEPLVGARAVEIYSPWDGRFVALEGAPVVNRFYHTITRLEGDRFLLAGGLALMDDGTLSLDLTTQVLRLTGDELIEEASLPVARLAGHGAVALPNGGVLLWGGHLPEPCACNVDPLACDEGCICDTGCPGVPQRLGYYFNGQALLPITDQSLGLAGQVKPTAFGALVPVGDGRTFLALGGVEILTSMEPPRLVKNQVSSQALLLTWSEEGNPISGVELLPGFVARYHFAALALEGGRALTLGGGFRQEQYSSSVVQLYEPSSGDIRERWFSSEPPLGCASDDTCPQGTACLRQACSRPARLIQNRQGHSATLLQDNTLLVAGGLAYEYARNTDQSLCKCPGQDPETCEAQLASGCGGDSAQFCLAGPWTCSAVPTHMRFTTTAEIYNPPQALP